MQPGVKTQPLVHHPMARLYPDNPTNLQQEPSKLSNSKKFSNALVYLDHIKKELGESQPSLYQDFLRVMSEFKSQSCDTVGVVSRIKAIFKDHPDLIREFNDFLPPGLQIPEEEIEALRNPKPVILNSARDYVQKIKARFVDEPAIYRSFLQILHAYKTEPNAALSGISVVTHQIKVLFKDHQDLVDQFHQFVKNDAPPPTEYPRKEEPHQPRKYERREKIEPQKIKAKKAKDDFRGRDHYRDKERDKSNNSYRFDEDDDYRDTDSSFEDETREQESKRTSVRQSLKRAAPVSRNHVKTNEQLSKDEYEEEEERVVRNHINIEPADKELFAKIKSSLGVRWKDFLKVMNMLNQGVIEKKEMCVITYHMLGEGELFEKFRKLINVSLEEFESVKNVVYSTGADIQIEDEDASESSSPETEEEKVRMEGAASYFYDEDSNTYSGRSQLEASILNYNWVSMPPPSDEKDPTFYSSPKNIYEEKLFECEDGRFELDVLIGRQNVVKGLLKNLKLDLDKGKKVSVEQYLGVLSCLCIKTLYGYEGDTVFTALCDYPKKVIPLIVDVLDRKGEELLVAKKVFDAQWEQVVNENYKKSLDQSINRPRESALREKGKTKEKEETNNMKVENELMEED
jgi:paired amphipathic helix protein Sin3a